MNPAVLIAKGILGGIGGSLKGASDNYSKISKKVGTDDTNNSSEFNDAGYGASNLGMDEFGKQKDAIINQFSSMKGNNAEAAKSGASSASSGASGASSGAASGAASSAGASAGAAAAAGASDMNLKSIYGDSIDDRIIENFAKIAAIDFKYKPEATAEYQGKYGVDDQEHIGIKAQELQDNEATKGTVVENENGDLIVDTRHLTFADTAAIAELSRRVLALEEIVKELQNK